MNVYVFIIDVSLILIGLGVASASAAAPLMAMPWLCLERCFNATSTDIAVQIASLKENQDVIDSVSFEQFNLGPNSTLLSNANLSPVAPALAALGFRTYAMVSSFPYPPEFITWLRELFADLTPFVRQCVSAAQAFNLTGFNLDFEPTSGATPQDALDYAAFLRDFSAAMHAHNLQVTADIAGWNALWNLTALNETAGANIDRFFYMGTYANNFTTFQSQLAKVSAAIRADKLGVGLMNYRGNNISDVLSDSEVVARFDSVLALPNPVGAIGLWAMPLSDVWYAQLRRWKSGGTSTTTSSSPSSATDASGSSTMANNGTGTGTGSSSNSTTVTANERLESPVVIGALLLAGSGCVVCVVLMLLTLVRRTVNLNSNNIPASRQR
jgi:hypothetical protein